MREELKVHHDKHDDFSSFSYSEATVNDLQTVYLESKLSDKNRNNFLLMLRYITLSICHTNEEEFLEMMASLSLFLNRVKEIGFLNARNQAGEENKEYLKNSIVKLTLI